MKNRIKNIIKRADFDFSFPYYYIALFTNPFFFVRRSLYKKVSKHSGFLEGKLLDFGCGCKPYKDLFRRVTNYIGLDIDDRGLDHTGSVIDVYYDGEHIPFEDGYFDSIFSSEVYEHVPNLWDIMLEINRVIKIGGIMMVSAPFAWNEHGVPYDFQRFTQYGMRNLLESNGFEIIRTEIATNYVEMLFQLWMEYIRHSFHKICSHAIFSLLIQILFIFPSAMMGCIVSFVLPENHIFYGDTIIIAKKVKNM